MSLTASEAFRAYEAVRKRLPTPVTSTRSPRRVATLEDLADSFDVFLLDAFGVLNIGETAIPGAPERVNALIQMGKRVLVVSNAASVPTESLLTKYTGMGFDFELKDIVSSRSTLAAAMHEKPRLHWGIMAGDQSPILDLGDIEYSLLADNPATYDSAEGFILLGSGTWTEPRQQLLESSLLAQMRPVLVANPDIVAPRETGFSKEPGHFAHQLADRTGSEPEFYGKPFQNIFDLAIQRLPGTNLEKAVMVGDSLHTDVLGAQNSGVASALVAEFGFFASGGSEDAMHASGIVPDYIVTRP